MKQENRNIDKLIHRIMEEPLVPSGYLPGNDFVSRVMDRVEDVNQSPMGRYLRMTLKIAASVAVVFFVTNLIVLISSLKADQSQAEMVETWSEEFSVNQSADWYEYYTDNRLSENQK
ncbi:MAG: hypothetical protein JEZ14_06810 [Marinilabiliaceae bacterium]|nr:hypothetical protein [Marinilabiliaceae bacterium]